MKNSKKTLLIAAVSLFSIGIANAQSYEEFAKQQREEYKTFAKKTKAEFKAYRDKVNAEYVDFMRKEWERMEVIKGNKLPDEPKPPKPIVVDPDTEITDNPMPFREEEIVRKNIASTKITPEPIIPLAKLPKVTPPKVVRPRILPEIIDPDKLQAKVDETKPDIKIPEAPQKPKEIIKEEEKANEEKFELADLPKKGAFTLDYYGTECQIDLKDEYKYSLGRLSESAVADKWASFSNDNYDKLLATSLTYRDYLKLNDWGYFKFVQALSNKLTDTKDSNESRLLVAYVMSQSGYKVRLAKAGEELALLMPFDVTIYERNYITVNGDNCYIIYPTASTSFQVFKGKFPNEKPIALDLKTPPALYTDYSSKKMLASTKFPDVTSKVSVNKNLINFYNDFPRLSDWDLFSRASLSNEVKAELYPALKNAIKGKNELTAANILLNFVQTSLKYKTDDAQFGYERALFGDESLYYPYCDCEDRSILYSILVRDLIGLDVVLLYYPGHLATAVKFNSDVKGDHFNLKEGKFTVCDPTYFGADAGLTMPQFRGVNAKIVYI